MWGVGSAPPTVPGSLLHPGLGELEVGGEALRVRTAADGLTGHLHRWRGASLGSHCRGASPAWESGVSCSKKLEVPSFLGLLPRRKQDAVHVAREWTSPTHLCVREIAP